MRSQIHFRHMERSEAVENYAKEKLEGVVEEFLHHGEPHVQIWLNAETIRRNASFKVEVDVRFPRNHEVFVHDSSDDMYKAIDKTMDTLKVVLREASTKDRKTKRRG